MAGDFSTTELRRNFVERLSDVDRVVSFTVEA
jgi:hypothetical protein